jgi:exodeoxyribonuclease VII small subunit
MAVSEEQMSFEVAMKSLEEAVRQLESGELPLAESIVRYKTAMDLVLFCRKQLDEAELQIEQLSAKLDGGPGLPE